MQKKSIPKTEKINGLVLLLVFGAALVAAVPLRTVQLFTNIEEHTGFFIHENWTVGVMYAILAITAAALFLLPVFSARIPASRPVVRKNLPMAVTSFLFAAGLAYDVLLCILKISRLFAAMTLVEAQGLYTLLFSNGLLAMLLQAVCGAAACVFMVLFAFAYLGRAPVYAQHKLLALTPLLWTLFRMVLRFMTKISFTVVSELLIELAMLAFMMLFFMSFARICAHGISHFAHLRADHAKGRNAKCRSLRPACGVPRTADRHNAVDLHHFGTFGAFGGRLCFLAGRARLRAVRDRLYFCAYAVRPPRVGG